MLVLREKNEIVNAWFGAIELFKNWIAAVGC